MSKTTDFEAKEADDSNKIVNSFRDAVRKKDLAQINAMLLKENVSCRDSCGDTFLHIVAESGTVETAIQLLQLGSNVHAQNHNDKTPLFYAIQNSDEMIKTLLDDKAIIDSSLLRHALFYRTEEIVRLLLQKTMCYKCPKTSSANVADRTRSRVKEKEKNNLDVTENLIKVFLHDEKYSLPKEKYYPLLIFFAAKIGKENVLQLVLDDCREYLVRNNKRTKDAIGHQQELNVQGDSGETALHYAVNLQDIDAVRFLLNNGANPTLPTKENLTPFQNALSLRNQELCEFLITFGVSIKPSYLIRRGYYPHPKCFPCLKEFAFNGFHNLKKTNINKEILKFLFTNRVDLIKKVKNYDFFDACEDNRLEEIKILVEFGLNIRNVDHNGNTALHYAVLGSAYQTIDFLLEKGLEIDVTNVFGETPFMKLLQRKRNISHKLLEFLVDRGSSLSAKSTIGISLFHCALFFNDSNFNSIIVLNLLELGGNKAWKNNSDAGNRFLTHEYYCPSSLARPPKLEPYGNGKQVLISYIAFKGDDISDYSICCLNPKNLGEWRLIFNNTKLELEKLKSRKILEQVCYSYYDFLAGDIKTAIRIIKSSLLKKELENFNNYQDFPCCKCLLEYRFNYVVDFEVCYDRIVNFLLNGGKVRLTIDVIEIILSYLSRRDFRVFDETLRNVKY